jgi:carbamoyl-phosphate synthase small subunit
VTRRAALLVLEDGSTFAGEAFTGGGTVAGEVVFNTAMSGYQEVLTDPSYRGQLVCMAAPQVGNYGTTGADAESERVQVAAFLVRQAARRPSSWRAERSLAAELEAAGVPGVEGIDTRRLVRHLRSAGAMRGALSTETTDPDALRLRALDAPDPNGLAMVDRVTRAEPLELPPAGPERHRVVVYDFGAKANIARRLGAFGARVLLVPAATPAGEALAWEPDGVMFSNGPGDPATVGDGLRAVSDLLGRVPLFGICLGHQILGLALGGATYKLKFGHHGANCPVMDLSTRKVEITSQNHGFAVDVDSLRGKAELTHVNLNDNTVEGMRLADRPAFSVQYHPEASPGPHDASYLFDRFMALIERQR